MELCECCVINSFAPNKFHQTLCNLCLHPKNKHVSLSESSPSSTMEIHYTIPNAVCLATDGSVIPHHDHTVHELSNLSQRVVSCVVMGSRRHSIDLLNELCSDLGDTNSFNPPSEETAASFHLHHSHVKSGLFSLVLTSIEPFITDVEPSSLSSICPTLSSVSGSTWTPDLARIAIHSSDIVLLASPFAVTSTQTFNLVADVARCHLHVSRGGLKKVLVIIGVGEEVEEMGRQFCVAFDKGDTLSNSFSQILAFEMPSCPEDHIDLFLKFGQNLRRYLSESVEFVTNRDQFVEGVKIPNSNILSIQLNLCSLCEFFANYGPIFPELSRLSSIYLSKETDAELIIGKSLLHYQTVSFSTHSLNFSNLETQLYSTLSFFTYLANYFIEQKLIPTLKILIKILIAILPCFSSHKDLQCLLPKCTHYSYHVSTFLGSCRQLTDQSDLIDGLELPPKYSKWIDGFPLRFSGEYQSNDFDFDCLFDWATTINSNLVCDDFTVVGSIVELIQSIFYDAETGHYEPLSFFPKFSCPLCFDLLSEADPFLTCGHQLCSFCLPACLEEEINTCHGYYISPNFCPVCGSTVEIFVNPDEVDLEPLDDHHLCDQNLDPENFTEGITTGSHQWINPGLLEGEPAAIKIEIFEKGSTVVNLALYRSKNGRQLKRLKSFKVNQSTVINYTPINSDVGFSINAVLTIGDVSNVEVSSVVSPCKPKYFDYQLENPEKSSKFPKFFHTSSVFFSYTYAGGVEGPSLFSWLRIFPNGSSELIKKNSLSQLGEDEHDVLSLQLGVDDIGCSIRLEVLPVRSDGVKGQFITCQTNHVLISELYLRPINTAIERGVVSFKLRLWEHKENGLCSSDIVVLRIYNRVAIHDVNDQMIAEFNYNQIDLNQSNLIARGLKISPITASFNPLILSTLKSGQPSDLIVLSFRRFRAEALELKPEFLFTSYSEKSLKVKTILNPLVTRK
ncbi:hypothetical protein P9112_005587 [Eukaryota sp. TZLM1-RC]